MKLHLPFHSTPTSRQAWDLELGLRLPVIPGLQDASPVGEARFREAHLRLQLFDGFLAGPNLKLSGEILALQMQEVLLCCAKLGCDLAFWVGRCQ